MIRFYLLQNYTNKYDILFRISTNNYTILLFSFQSPCFTVIFPVLLNFF